MATNGSPELLIVMGAGATADQTEHVLARLQEAGVHARVTHGREATVIGAIGDRELLATLPLEGYPGVEQVLPILKPYKLVAREVSPDPTVIEVDGRRLGDSWFGLIAGPCSVEYREQTLETARVVAKAGATMLRGGACKPDGRDGDALHAGSRRGGAPAARGAPAGDRRSVARGGATRPGVAACARGGGGGRGRDHRRDPPAAGGGAVGRRAADPGGRVRRVRARGARSRRAAREADRLSASARLGTKSHASGTPP